jgi:hypothetical protein
VQPALHVAPSNHLLADPRQDAKAKRLAFSLFRHWLVDACECFLGDDSFGGFFPSCYT